MKRTQENLMEMQEKEEPVSVSITNGMASFEIMARVDGYKTSADRSTLW